MKSTRIYARFFMFLLVIFTVSCDIDIVDPTLKVRTPSFSPSGGTYATPQIVSIHSATLDATVRYTVDGSQPTSTSPIYTSPIDVSISTTIKAKAYVFGWESSSTASATYTIEGE